MMLRALLGLLLALVLVPTTTTRASWNDGASVRGTSSAAGTASAATLRCEGGLLSTSRTVYWAESTSVPGAGVYTAAVAGVGGRTFDVVARSGGGYQVTVEEGLLGGLLDGQSVVVTVSVLIGTGWARSSSITLGRGLLGVGLRCP